MKAYLLVFFLLNVSFISSYRNMTVYDIDLDLPVDQRFEKILIDFNETIIATYNDIFGDLGIMSGIALDVADLRGPEVDELQGELNHIANFSGLDVRGIQLLQFLYELSSFGNPLSTREIEESIGMVVPAKLLEKMNFLAKGMCTGIVAKDTQDGAVYHARNLDFGPAEDLAKLLYIGVFKKGGKEIFRAQMIAGYQGVLTGYKEGQYSLAVNTRFSNEVGENAETLDNLFVKKRQLNSWQIRKIFETVEGFDNAVASFSKAQIVAPTYWVIGGVNNGTILARAANKVEHQISLTDENRFICVTNNDYWKGEAGADKSSEARRIGANTQLNATDVITPNVLAGVINSTSVKQDDTIAQLVMSVQNGYFSAWTNFD